MQVILKEDVPALGKAGEVIRVAEGFGRNFLLPRKKAVPATETNLKVLEQGKKAIEARRAKLREEAEAFAQKISSLKISIAKQAGEEEKIFGSVSAAEITKALDAQGVKLDKRLIRFKETIRQTGIHTVEVHLHGDVVVPLQVEVIKK